jgi:hypothetical protein
VAVAVAVQGRCALRPLVRCPKSEQQTDPASLQPHLPLLTAVLLQLLLPLLLMTLQVGRLNPAGRQMT